LASGELSTGCGRECVAAAGGQAAPRLMSICRRTTDKTALQINVFQTKNTLRNVSTAPGCGSFVVVVVGDLIRCGAKPERSMPNSEPATQTIMNSEEFWDDLLAYVEDGRVVPVVGPELHTIVIGGREIPLYRALAEQLLKKYGLEACDADGAIPPSDDKAPLRKDLELNDAVSGISQRGRRVADLYRPINDELRKLLAAQPEIPQPLCDLARITDFRLFVSTTFDDTLARAIDSARAGNGPPTRSDRLCAESAGRPDKRSS
jgi:hypothetical protein